MRSLILTAALLCLSILGPGYSPVHVSSAFADDTTLTTLRPSASTGVTSPSAWQWIAKLTKAERQIAPFTPIAGIKTAQQDTCRRKGPITCCDERPRWCDCACESLGCGSCGAR
jgi:hypothetical protein